MSQPQHNIGIDIGGTKINAALVDLSGKKDPLEGAFENRPTPTTLDAFVDTIVEEINVVKKSASVGAIGISTAGSVDTARGCIIGATGNLPFIKGEFQFKKILEDRVKIPVHVENDANAAAYGELMLGAARGENNMVMVTLGTGVGVGVIVHGKMVRGSHYSAEGGHIIVRDQGRMCTCGRPDCWEAYASGKGFAISIREMLKAAPSEEQTAFLAFGKTGHTLENADTHDWVPALKANSPLAAKMHQHWLHDVALGIASIINMIDPQSIVVGGGLMDFVDFDQLGMIVKPMVLTPAFSIKPATLGNHAGLVGAAFLASQAVPVGI